MDTNTAPAQGTKVCAKCHKTLPLQMFASSAHNADGHHSYCRACMAAYNAERYKKKGCATPVVSVPIPDPNPDGRRGAEESLLAYLAQVPPRYLIKTLFKRGYRGELTFTETKTVQLGDL